jgi:hypothetical protein
MVPETETVQVQVQVQVQVRAQVQAQAQVRVRVRGQGLGSAQVVAPGQVLGWVWTAAKAVECCRWTARCLARGRRRLCRGSARASVPVQVLAQASVPARAQGWVPVRASAPASGLVPA